MELDGRVAVVTGGGRGIGAAVARALAARGARVVVVGRHVESLRQVSPDHVTCDVTQPEQVGAMAAHVRSHVGAPAILVNNAGAARSAKLADTDEALWRDMLEVNLTGAYRVTRELLADVLAAGKRGRIINIGSVASKVGFAYTTAYCAAKHGLLGLTRALALEVAAKGVTVNCVCPGWVDTDMGQAAIDHIARTTGRSPGEARATLERMSPQRRLMTADEVAAAVAFLATDAAAGVTGQSFSVDGGEVMS